MKVKLISTTTHPTMSLEEYIAFIARVSSPNNQHNHETAPRLLQYLIKHAHWSPFELNSVCFELETSQFVAAQILRHKSFSFSQISRRYTSEGAGTNEPVELRLAGSTNRQSSLQPLEGKIKDRLDSRVQQVQELSSQVYRELLEANVAKEVARSILPQCNSTVLYMNGSIRSWLTYLNLRLQPNVQKEHRLLALEIAKELAVLIPEITKATNNFNNFEGNFI